MNEHKRIWFAPLNGWHASAACWWQIFVTVLVFLTYKGAWKADSDSRCFAKLTVCNIYKYGIKVYVYVLKETKVILSFCHVFFAED